MGTVASVDGDTLVVNTAEGPVRVRIGANTALQKQVPADRGDLAPGQRVAVSGERDGEGTVAAAGVQILSGDGAGDQAATNPARRAR
jgi:hypothetical protein